MAQFGPEFPDSSTKKWLSLVRNQWLSLVRNYWLNLVRNNQKMDGGMEKRCDGVLTFQPVAIFVELKERGALGIGWVKDAEKQLRVSIAHFENTIQSVDFTQKKAYIANSEHPKFKESQSMRMEKFLAETGYVLRIENRITL
ncbi:MAG: hypothetical protein NVV82_04420 [Sporocytophaga sp.]|nr:hypothetical protein [Sporocytophaga sp.]